MELIVPVIVLGLFGLGTIVYYFALADLASKSLVTKRAGRSPIPPSLRWEIHRRDGYRCVYCRGEGELQLDHVIPHSRGGEDTYENLVTACRNCNLLKGARTPQEAGMRIWTNSTSF